MAELKGPFLIFTLKVNPDAKHERVASFSNLKVTEKTSGKSIFNEDNIVIFNADNTTNTSFVVEDQVRLVKRVNNLLEDTIRVEGIMTLVKKSSRTAKEIGAGKDVAFETCL